MSLMPTPALSGGPVKELPRYKCHKEVWALKIKDITPRPRPTIEELETILNSSQVASDEDIVGATITPEDPDYAPFPVSQAYMMKHQPEPGGYYVVYSGGYKSYSPAKAFEEGYTKIT